MKMMFCYYLKQRNNTHKYQMNYLFKNNLIIEFVLMA